MTILIQEPPEFDPVELVRVTQQRYPDLRYRHFAVALGVSQSTIDKWMAGYKRPSKSNRILAAMLAQKWGMAV